MEPDNQTTEGQLAGLIMDADLPKRLQAELTEAQEKLQECSQQNLKLSNAAKANQALRAELAEAKAERDAMRGALEMSGCALRMAVADINADDHPEDFAYIEESEAKARAALNPSPEATKES